MIVRPPRLWGHPLRTCRHFYWTFFLFWHGRNHFRYCPWMISTTLIDVVNTIWVKTDQYCPYGNSTPGHSAMKMNQFQSSLPLLIVGVIEKNSVEYTFSHFLPFNLLSKSLISSDLKWLAKPVLVAQLWSLHKISGQENNFVEGKWWTVRGVWQSGFKHWLGTLRCVLGHDTYIVTLSVPLSLPRCINGYWLT